MSSPSPGTSGPAENRFLNSYVGILTLIGAFFLVVLLGSIDLRIQAAFFPRIIGTAGLILTGILFLQYFSGRGSDPAPIPYEVPPEGEVAIADDREEQIDDRRPYAKFLIPLIAAPVYAVLLIIFGFYIAAGTVIAVLPWLLGYRHLLFLIVLSISTVLALHICFSVLLNIPIPAGYIGEWFLRNYVYTD
jgi:hypothetical protein